MPLKAFKCVVEVNVHAVSAPGVRLSNKQDIYLNVCLLGQQRRTRLVPPIFPLEFNDNLKFEKTFKYCRDPSDVVELLNSLHCLIELIQVGVNNESEVLAQFNTNAKEFLYPIPDGKLSYHSSQRDLFMTRWNLPTIISPQLQFCSSTSISETQTPSLDILKEYDERYKQDPIMDIKNKRSKSATNAIRIKSSKQKRNGSNKRKKHFEKHTIASAIKSNYSQPEVQTKLKELNSSVCSEVETSAILLNDSNKPQPFIVGHVSNKLIGRQPSAHNLLSDGLTLTRKSRDRSSRKRSASPSKSSRSSPTRSQSRSHSVDTSNEPQINIVNQQEDKEVSKEVKSDFKSASKLYGSIKKYDSSLGNSSYFSGRMTKKNCNRCSNSHSNCDVCFDYRTRTAQNLRAQKYHHDETSITNSSALFDRTNALANKVALETTRENRFLNSSDYLNRSYSALYPYSRTLVDPYADYYPLNRSFDYYALPLHLRYPTYRYDKLYPWYYRYSDYLSDLDDELRSLKLRRKYL